MVFQTFKVQTIGDAYVIASGLPYADQTTEQRVGFGEMTSPSLVQQVRDILVWGRLSGAVGAALQGLVLLAKCCLSIVNCCFVCLCQQTQDYENSTAKNAARLLAMAFEMLEIVKTVSNPATGEPIQMRIGIHTGSIVAGAFLCCYCLCFSLVCCGNVPCNHILTLSMQALSGP